MKLRMLLLVLCTVFNSTVFSQSVDFTGLKRIRAKNMRPIIVNNVVQGYFAFFLVDKANSKSNNYLLKIMDNNLKETHEVSFIKPKTTSLVEGEFNGSHFCFFYSDYKSKSQTLEMRDATGKKTGSYRLDAKKENLAASATEDSPVTQSLIAVPNKGFVVVKYDKNTGYQTSLIFIDNAGKKGWESKKPSPDAKSWDSQSVMYSDDKYLLSMTTTRAKALSTKGMKTYLTIYNINDGSEEGEIEMNTGRHALSPYGANYDPISNQILLYGEYYLRNKKGNLDIKNKVGFFISKYKPNGELVKEGFASWEKDIKPVIPFDPDEKKKGDRLSIIVHHVISTSDGKFYAIGEQYKKAASAGGIALAMLAAASGDAPSASTVKIVLKDMMVFKFDENLEIEEIKIIKKKKTSMMLPAGYGTIQKDKLGYMMKTMGWFDYAFTSVSASRKTFNSVYLNFDRKNEGKNKMTIGNITLNDEGKIEDVKVNLATNPTWFRAIPSKPGYIAVFEYFKKKKMATLKLKKLDI